VSFSPVSSIPSIPSLTLIQSFQAQDDIHTASKLLRKMKALNVNLHPIEVLSRDAGEKTWSQSFTKLMALGLTEYDRVIHFNSDGLIFKNLGELRRTCRVVFCRAFGSLSSPDRTVSLTPFPLFLFIRPPVLLFPGYHCSLSSLLAERLAREGGFIARSFGSYASHFHSLVYLRCCSASCLLYTSSSLHFLLPQASHIMVLTPSKLMYERVVDMVKGDNQVEGPSRTLF